MVMGYILKIQLLPPSTVKTLQETGCSSHLNTLQTNLAESYIMKNPVSHRLASIPLETVISYILILNIIFNNILY